MGIAASYPGDVGIETDPAVILVERFGDNVASIASRLAGTSTITTGVSVGSTGQTGNTAGMAMVADAPVESANTLSLQMSALGGTDTGGYLFLDLGTLEAAGYTELYTRWYVKYGATGELHHNGMTLGGQNPHSVFLPSLCCDQPTGSDNFAFETEPGHPSGFAFDLYARWMEMHDAGFSSIPECGGLCYFGNTFGAGPTITPDTWICVESHITLNTPTTSRNGALQLFVDGTERINLTEGAPLGSWTTNVWTTGAGATPFEGFRWRATDSLAINFIRVQHFADTNPVGVTSTTQFANLVLATSAIGPLSGTSESASPTSPRVSNRSIFMSRLH